MDNQSIYTAVELPIDEELYIVDFDPIYDRQKVHSLTTYLCSRPFILKEHFWVRPQPCHSMDGSILIHEWYYNIPAVEWPKDAGFRVGINTPYRYIVIHIQYLSSVTHGIYGQKLIMTRKRPKYKIGAFRIETNSVELKKYQAPFSCRYQFSSIQIFSTRAYSNNEGRSVSLYRIRNNKSELIIKGNLHWPQTFYQLQNSIDIKTNDYLIGSCVYENRTLIQYKYELICQMTIMFSMKQEDEMPIETCWNTDNPRIVDRFLPIDAVMPPETLFDINPTYPKLTPDQWAIMNINGSNLKDKRVQKLINLIHMHKLLFLMSLWGFALLIGFIILLIVIMRSRKNRKYFVTNNNRSRKIIVGGETSSLSGWLTKRRFQESDQYKNNNNDDGENEPLTKNHRWASSDEESDLSDNDVFNKTDFRKVQLKN